MANEITLSFLFNVLKSVWWKVLIFTVIVALIAASFTAFLIPKKYASSTVFYIINTSVSNEYTTTALLSAAEQLANDYIEIIRSDSVLSKIAEDVSGKGYPQITPKSIRPMISAATSTEASTFSVTVTSTDKELAYLIAQSIEANAPSVIKNITRPSYTANLYKFAGAGSDGEITADDFVRITEENLECVKIIGQAKLATSHSSPNLITNTILAAIIAVVLSYGIALIRKLFDTVIRSEASVKTMVKQPILANIPIWSVNVSASSNSDKK